MSPWKTFYKVSCSLQGTPPIISYLSWLFKRTHKSVIIFYTPNQQHAYLYEQKEGD